MIPPPNPRLDPIPDPLTPARDITHQHFQPGEEVIVVKGVAGGELWGESVRVVAASWHTPTDENGWRVRNPTGGRRSYLTAHPRYLVHLRRRCPDCLIHLRALEDYLLHRYISWPGVIDCAWYTATDLGQLVHINDMPRGGR